MAFTGHGRELECNTPAARLDRVEKRLAELEKNDQLFHKIIDKLTADNGGTIPGWILDLVP